MMYQQFTSLHQLMHIYLKNNPAKFHPNLISNDETFGLFKECHPQQFKNNISKDMGSVSTSVDTQH